MSLRRRIALAAAFAVAAVAVAISVVGYVSTRSHLIGELQHELWDRARPFLEPHRGQEPGGPGGGTFPGPGDGGPPRPGAPAAGFFQGVTPDGSVALPAGESGQLPVTPQVRAIARRASGSFFSTASVNGARL